MYRLHSRYNLSSRDSSSGFRGGGSVLAGLLLLDGPNGGPSALFAPREHCCEFAFGAALLAVAGHGKDAGTQRERGRRRTCGATHRADNARPRRMELAGQLLEAAQLLPHDRHSRSVGLPTVLRPSTVRGFSPAGLIARLVVPQPLRLPGAQRAVMPVRECCGP
jgi:hypothetical protein